MLIGQGLLKPGNKVALMARSFGRTEGQCKERGEVRSSKIITWQDVIMVREMPRKNTVKSGQDDDRLKEYRKADLTAGKVMETST